jgi:hypothetical protein
MSLPMPDPTSEANNQPALTYPTGPYSPPRRIWIGFVFALLYLGLEIAGIGQENEDIALWASLAGLVGWICWLTCVSRFHKILGELSPYEDGEPTYLFTPRRSVIYHFIPLLNVYWIFRWPREMVKFLREQTSVQIVSGWGLGAILFIGVFLGGLGLCLMFGVGLYLSGRLRQAIAEHEAIRGAAGVFT